MEGKDDKILIPVLIHVQIGPEFQCLEGEDENSNVYQNRARILMFGSISS